MDPPNENSSLTQYFVTFTINLVALGVGSALGWISPNIDLLSSSDSPFDPPLTKEELSWSASIVFLVATFSSYLFTYTSNYVRRKSAMCLISISLMISWSFTLYGQSAIYLLIGRILLGISTGGVFCIIPIYIVEIAEERLRERLTSLLYFNINAGIFLSFVIGSIMSYHHVIYLLTVIPILYCIVALFFVPESPVFLIRTEKEEKAYKSLRRLRGLKKDDIRNEKVEEEFIALKLLSRSEEPRIGVIDFKTPTVQRGIYLSMMILIIQQLSGFIPIMSYASVILKTSGIGASYNTSTIVVALLFLIGSGTANYVFEQFGRKVLLAGSSLGILTGYIIFAIFAQGIKADFFIGSYEWVLVAALSLSMFSYTSALGPIGLTVVAEIFSAHIRPVVLSFYSCMSWFVCFLFSKFFLSFIDVAGIPVTFWALALFQVYAFFFFTYSLPETKGKTTEVILKKLRRYSSDKNINTLP